MLSFDISLEDLDCHSRSQLYEKSKTLVFIFSEISQWIWMEFNLLPQPVGLLKLMLNLFCTSTIQGREICWCEFVKYMIYIVLCRDICEPSSSSSFAFPSCISGVHHFGWDFCVCNCFFNPTIEIVTFHIRGWCMLGVVLLLPFTHLGHEC